MEHLSGGNLWDLLQSHGPMRENEARGIFQQLVSVVHYCHQKGIVHRDLKPTNALLDTDLNVKLADFGLSAHVNERKLSIFCDNLFYVAPELILAKRVGWSSNGHLEPGSNAVQDGHWDLPFQGRGELDAAEEVVSGKNTVPFYLSSQLQYFLTN